MKNVSVIVAVVFLAPGVSKALPNRINKSTLYASTVFLYTQSGIAAFTGTRTTAQEVFQCNGSQLICAAAWTTYIPHEARPVFSMFYDSNQ